MSNSNQALKPELEQVLKPMCSHCKVEKEARELNGQVLVEGGWDYSKAYCAKIFECDSKEARKITKEVGDMTAKASVFEKVTDPATNSTRVTISEKEITTLFIEQLEIIASQIDDEKISVKRHFSLVSKAMALTEMYQTLCENFFYMKAPVRISELSRSISESYFN